MGMCKHTTVVNIASSKLEKTAELLTFSKERPIESRSQKEAAPSANSFSSPFLSPSLIRKKTSELSGKVAEKDIVGLPRREPSYVDLC